MSRLSSNVLSKFLVALSGQALCYCNVIIIISFLIAEFQRAWMFSVCAREGNLLFFGSLALGGVPVANSLERLPILCA